MSETAKNDTSLQRDTNNSNLRDHHTASSDCVCKVCHEPSTVDDQLIYPCKCKGSMKFIHNSCLAEWTKGETQPNCQICKHPFRFEMIYKTGTPKWIPLSLVLWDMGVFMLNCLRGAGCFTLAVTKLALIYCINSAAVGPLENGVRQLAVAFLILFNYTNYKVCQETQKCLTSYVSFLRRMRMNVGNSLVSTGTVVSSAEENAPSNETESDIEEETQYMNPNTWQFYRRPFSLEHNMKMFLPSATLGLFIVLCRLLYGILCKSTLPSPRILLNYFLAVDFKSNNIFMRCIRGYQEYLSAQGIYAFFIGYLFCYSAVCVVCFMLYLVKINTDRFPLKYPFFYAKVLLVTSLIKPFFYLVQGTILMYVKYRMNIIPFGNGMVPTSYASVFSLAYHSTLGYFMLSLHRELVLSLGHTLRVGLAPAEKLIPDSPLLIRNALEGTFFISILKMMRVICVNLCLSSFVLHSIPVFVYSGEFSVFFMLLISLGILKCKAVIMRILLKQYTALLTQISCMFSLDNYLYGTKMLKYESSRLFWASNTRQNVTKRVEKANSLRRVEVSADLEEYMESMHKDTSTPSGFYTRSQLSRIPPYGAESDTGSVQSSINTDTDRYTINNRRLIKYFGRKHLKALTIVYKPRATQCALMLFRFLCLCITKMNVEFMHNISQSISQRVVGFSFIRVSMRLGLPVDKFVYWGTMLLLLELFDARGNVLKSLALGLYVSVWSPLLFTVFLLATQSRMVSFSSLFYFISLMNNVIQYILKSIISGGDITDNNTNNITDSVDPMGASRTTAVLFMGTVINILAFSLFITIRNNCYMLVIQTITGLYALKITVGFMKKLLLGGYIEEVRNKYYLQEKKAVNYHEA